MTMFAFNRAVPSSLRAARFRRFTAVTLALLPAWLWSADEPVAVFSTTFNGYQRTRLPDHSFKPETYAFGEGGASGIEEPHGATGKLTFMRVARAAALPLAQANYVPSSNPDKTSLLITVFWGRTLGSRDAAHSFIANVQTGYGGALGPSQPGKSSFGSSVNGPAAPTAGLHSAGAKAALLDVSAANTDALIEQASLDNPRFDQIDDSNARIVGYSEALFRARHSPNSFVSREVVDEVAHNRYYVILQAYDFRLAWKEKKLKLLWEARISVAEDDNDFDQLLDRMLVTATRSFGRDSNGLQRAYVPEGKVIIGPHRVIEDSPPTK